jgi:serine/threonine-protein kinase
MNAVLEMQVPPPSQLRADVTAELDRIVERGLARDPDERFATAREMAIALERAVTPASPREIGEWVEAAAATTLMRRAEDVHRIESSTASSAGAPPSAPPSALAVAPAALAEEAPTKTFAAAAAADDAAGARGVRRRALPWAVALLAVASALVASLLLFRSRPASVPEPTSAAASSSAAPVVPVATMATASEVPLSSPSALPVGSARPAVHNGATHAKPPAHPVNCKPPYTIDADGTRVWKKGC